MASCDPLQRQQRQPWRDLEICGSLSAVEAIHGQLIAESVAVVDHNNSGAAHLHEARRCYSPAAAAHPLLTGAQIALFTK
jgi:hypothetical protein